MRRGYPAIQHEAGGTPRSGMSVHLSHRVEPAAIEIPFNSLLGLGGHAPQLRLTGQIRVDAIRDQDLADGRPKACVGQNSRLLSVCLGDEPYNGIPVKGLKPADADDARSTKCTNDGRYGSTHSIVEWQLLAHIGDSTRRAEVDAGARSSATCLLDSGSVPGKARSRRPFRCSHIGCPRLVVWLSHGLRGPDAALGGEWLKRGLLCSK
jgi:hypothetical protein